MVHSKPQTAASTPQGALFDAAKLARLLLIKDVASFRAPLFLKSETSCRHPASPDWNC
jgi:hypothetical protein